MLKQAGLLASLILSVALVLGPGAGVAAQDRGTVTNLPLPRFVSMKAAEANMRRGPSLTHKIDWVLTRRNMPLEVIAEYGNWRRVRDKDGATGWVHYSLLSGARTVIVEDDLTGLRARPETDGTIKAYLEAGVVAWLGECDPDWCWINADSYKGWVHKSALWGVAPDEIRQ